MSDDELASDSDESISAENSEHTLELMKHKYKQLKEENLKQRNVIEKKSENQGTAIFFKKINYVFTLEKLNKSK